MKTLTLLHLLEEKSLDLAQEEFNNNIDGWNALDVVQFIQEELDYEMTPQEQCKAENEIDEIMGEAGEVLLSEHIKGKYYLCKIKEFEELSETEKDFYRKYTSKVFGEVMFL